MTTATRPRIGFVLEQTLGHITHANNLRALAVRDPRIHSAFASIGYDLTGLAAYVPGFGNWTVRDGFRTRMALRRLRRVGRIDALFFHTQVPAVLMPDVLRKIPSVVSLDATPLQYDELGSQYEHSTRGPILEKMKWRLNRHCFANASAVVTWAAWTKASVVDDYGVDASRVVVIPPGVRVDQWARSGPRDDVQCGPMRILFVGGDLQRKGGTSLLDAVRRLRSSGVDVELDLVTKSDVLPEAGVVVHRNMQANSPELIALYHRADVFCLPTMGDCLPMVLSEAGAAGLPLVSTRVGAIPEVVRHGETGLLVPVGDTSELTATLAQLAADPTLRRRLGDSAARLVNERFDAAVNARRLVGLLTSVAAGEVP